MFGLLSATFLLATTPASSIGNSAASVLPLYDMVTRVTSTTSGCDVSANFMTSGPLPDSNTFDQFRTFFYPTDTAHFSPIGDWQEMTNKCQWKVSGNVVTMSFSSSGNLVGTLWVQYPGASTDPTGGRQISVVATQLGGNRSSGGGGRPGALIPITRTASDLDIPYAFYMPFGGSWDGTTGPMYWQSGTDDSPSTGWSTLDTAPVRAATGSNKAVATARPSASKGFYAVGLMQSLPLNESYNPGGTVWPQFSAIIRPYGG